MKVGSVQTVDIESLAYRGEGIGHIQNKVIFVPLTAPGDSVEVKLSENKRNYLRGTVQEFKKRSPHRVVPLCDYFGDCGGCHWQHLDYDYELGVKAEILADTLARIGKIPPDTYTLLPPLPSPRSYGYRCRVRLQCLTQRRIHIGFFRAHSQEIVPIDRCELVPSFLNDVLKKLQSFLNSLDHIPPFTEIEVLVLPSGEEATICFTSSGEPNGRTHDFLKELKTQIPKVYGVSIETEVDGAQHREHFGTSGLDFVHQFQPTGQEEPLEIRCRTRLQSFCQVNPEQNQNLLRTLYEWAEPDSDKLIVDLFCGAGNLSLPLARAARRIIGLESNEMAVEDARHNAEVNGLRNCDYRLGNVFDIVEEVKHEGPVDVLLVDPPRKGVKECAGKLVDLQPAKILYVSCNPPTLARDASLFAYSNYRLRRLQLVDMFPQTYHIESVAEFTRES